MYQSSLLWKGATLAVAMGALTLVKASTFSDNFDSGASPLWGQEVGTWSAAGGVYNCTTPNNIPPVYSGLPFVLTDCAVDVDVNAIRDGGIWLRSSNHGTGVLLVTGGNLGTFPGFYWHICHNGSYQPPIGYAYNQFALGSNVHVRATVVGNVYSVFLNGNTVAASSITTSEFPSGRVALYDYSAQTFDNFQLSGIPSVSGHARLTNFVGETAGDQLWVEVYQGGNLVETLDGHWGPDGAFSISPSVSGLVTLRFRSRAGIPKRMVTTIGTNPVIDANVLMTNGDVDNSGEIDAADIDLVILHFGETPSSPGALRNADVDGSGEVDAADIDIVILNFGAVES